MRDWSTLAKMRKSAVNVILATGLAGHLCILGWGQQNCPDERDQLPCAHWLEPAGTLYVDCPPCAEGDAIYLGSGTSAVDGAGWLCLEATPVLLPATGQTAFGALFPWVDVLHGSYSYVSSPAPGGKHGGYWLFGLERIQLVVSSEQVQNRLWRGTPTEFYWGEGDTRRSSLIEVVVYDLNGDALRFFGPDWNLLQPAKGVYAQLMPETYEPGISPTSFILTGGPPGAMRQPGSWTYRFEMSSPQRPDEPCIPNWGHANKALLRDKRIGGTSVLPAIQSPLGHRWWINWNVTGQGETEITVDDEQSEATLIFRLVVPHVGPCCSWVGCQADDGSEKWRVFYRHPQRTQGREIELGYVASCYRVERMGETASPKENTVLHWNGIYPHEQVRTVFDFNCTDANEKILHKGGALGRNDTVIQQTELLNWFPILEREQLLYQSAYNSVPINTKGRLAESRLMGLSSTYYSHWYRDGDAHFEMQVQTTKKDTTLLEYKWDRSNGMFETLLSKRPAINSVLSDEQRRRWSTYEVTQYEFNSDNGQVERITRWLEDADGNRTNPLWEERYEYLTGTPYLTKFVDRQGTEYTVDYCSVGINERLPKILTVHRQGQRLGLVSISYGNDLDNLCMGRLPTRIQIGTDSEHTWQFRYSDTSENLAPSLLRFVSEPGRGAWEIGYYPKNSPYANKPAFVRDPTQRQSNIAYDQLGRPALIEVQPESGRSIWVGVEQTLLGQPRVTYGSDGSQARYLWEGERLRAFDDPRAVFEYHNANWNTDFTDIDYLTQGSPRRLWLDYGSYSQGGLLKSIRFGGESQGRGKLFASFEYDSYGRLTRVAGGNGVGVDYTYGDQHELRAIRHDGDRISEQFDYENCCGRVRSWTLQDGVTAYFSYTLNGWLEAIRLGSENAPPVFRYDYDGAGRLGLAESPLSRITFRYDTEDPNFGVEQGTPSKITGWLQKVRTELKTLSELPLGIHEQSYTYYPSGDVETVTNSWNGQPFSSIRYHYDDAGRLLAIDYLGQRLAEYSYDGAGRLIRQTVYPIGTSNSLNALIQYADNQSLGAVGQMEWRFNTSRLASFDSTGSPNSPVESDPSDPYYGRGYYPDGTLRRLDEQLWDPLRNDYRSQHWWFDYDVDGSLKKSRRFIGQELTLRDYTYDNGGNLLSRGDESAWYYEYNRLYHVPAERSFFTYTPRGERYAWFTRAEFLRTDVNRDGRVDDADLLAVQFAFGRQCSGCPEDVNNDGQVDDGDFLAVLYDFGRVSGSDSWRYHYDFWGNLVWAYSRTGWSYHTDYDALGRRIAEKIQEGSVIHRELYFLYDGDIIIAEVDGTTGQVVAEYVWGPLGPIARIDLRNPANTRYYVIDSLGHTRLLVNASGEVTDLYIYDEWGNLIGAGNPSQGQNLTRNPFTWNGAFGYEWVPETGLYHVGAREYDPRTARWLQRDPIRVESGDPNLYRYCGNDPLNGVDPSGLDWLDTTANFFAGVGDSLTFGATDWIRERLGVNEVVDKTSTAYIAGEWTEVGVEIVLSGGSKYLLKQALKKGRKTIRDEAVRLTRKFRERGREVHHRNPLLGHPGGGQTLFPTGGLPPQIHSGRWNLEVLDHAGHMKHHRRLKVLENALRLNTNRYTVPGRVLNNASRDATTRCP